MNPPLRKTASSRTGAKGWSEGGEHIFCVRQRFLYVEGCMLPIPSLDSIAMADITMRGAQVFWHILGAA